MQLIILTLKKSPLVVVGFRGAVSGLALRFPEFTAQLKSLGTETSFLGSPVDGVSVVAGLSLFVQLWWLFSPSDQGTV